MNNKENTSQERQKFEEIRDKYFINPRAVSSPEFLESVRSITKRLSTNSVSCQTESQSLIKPELALFTSSLIERFEKARNFDEKSMAQIHPNGCEPAILANMASTLKNNNIIVREVSPVESVMEDECIDWLNQEISGYNAQDSSGAIVTDGTLANITGLLIAREKLLNSKQKRSRVWNGRDPVVVLANELAHYSISKACSLLGTSDSIRVIKIPVDRERYCVRVDVLKEKISEFKNSGVPIMAIVAIAGETETGIVDPLKDIADIAEENKIYLHVDGAYGGPYVLSRKRELFTGIDRSNSLTIDPHKYLYTPYSTGSILFRDQQEHSLIERLSYDGKPYMFKSSTGKTFKERTANNHGQRKIEGSMGGHGPAGLWAVINTLGSQGIELLLNHNIETTQYAFNKLKGSRYFNVLCEPDLNTICIYPKLKSISSRPKLEKKLVEKTAEALEIERGVYISTTTLPSGDTDKRDLTVFRMVITHPYTEMEQVDLAIDGLHSAWEKVVKEYKEVI